MRWTRTTTPAGPFAIVFDDEGAVVAAGWTDDPAPLLARCKAPPALAAVARHDGASAAVDAVTAYCDGVLEAPATIAVRQSSSPFVDDAWRALRGVGAGEVVTYTELAARAGRPAAVRAAASACAANPSALFVPCHRVVRRDHGLGGFAWGLDVKRWLLDHEHAATHGTAA